MAGRSSSLAFSAQPNSSPVFKGARKARRKFLRFFPKGFYDPTYIDWERDYKWEAHEQWNRLLKPSTYRSLLRASNFREIADHAVRIESRTNLLFSFEKMALRDAVKTDIGARNFSRALFEFLYGPGPLSGRFKRWCEAIAGLPRKQTRVLTWPIATVFGFIAQPENHIFLKPNVTRLAASQYGFDFNYQSKPSWDTYASVLEFANVLEHDLIDLRPRDMIDIQSFIWVQGSDEY
jgi:hypothetical protein